MTTLYNCHTDGDQYRITKFDSLGNVESTYLCTTEECECPAGVRLSCRHRQMLPIFIDNNKVNSFFFYDFDRKGWVTNEPAVSNDPMLKPAEMDSMPPLPDGVEMKPGVPIAITDKILTDPPPFRRRV